MDNRSFDQLVKRLSEQRSRRTSLRALAGGALAAAVLAESATEAKKRKKKCKAPKVKCGRKLCCAAGQACVNGACVTPTTTSTIPGGCTSVCSPGDECVNAQCVCNSTLCDAATNPNPGQTDCFCETVTGGQKQCIAGQLCTAPVDCDSGGNCPSGFICQVNGCGGNPTCVKACV